MLARLSFGALGVAALLGGCTGDFDAFDFDGGTGGAGGDGATGNGSSGGDGATGNASAGGGGSGSGGAGNAATGGAGTGGAGGAAVLVGCGAQPCDITSGAACCVDLDNAMTSICEADGKCGGGEVEVTCDGPEDCPGEVCCASEKGGELDKLHCKGSCGNNEETVCQDSADCGGNDCDPGIPGGYSTCD